jgi:mannose/fructose/N-acetylgalactosamine-specific phosphotransferase system component IID
MPRKKEVDTMATIKLSRAVLWQTFVRFIFAGQLGWNYERMQSIGYCYSMLPIFKVTRPDPEDFKAAFITNLSFFNTNPIIGTPFIMGAHAALEEAGASLDTTEGLKMGLMGPLASVGDTLVWALYNSIIFALGANWALQGNIFGPIFVALMSFIPFTLARWWIFNTAYKQGVSLATSFGSGAIARITEVATIIGLMVIGGFAPSIVNVKTPLTLSSSAIVNGSAAVTKVVIQTQLDAIIPYLLPVLTVALVYWLLKKGWSPIQAIGLLVVAGFVLGAFGVLGG